MIRKLGWLSVLGIVLAGACTIGFAEWLISDHPQFTPPKSIAEYSINWLWFGVDVMAGRQNTTHAYALLRSGLAFAGIMGSVLGVLLFLRASDNAPARQVAWLLVGYSAYTLVTHFLTVDLRYGLGSAGNDTLHILSWILFAWIAVSLARFLVIFPRPVDGESLLQSYWQFNLKITPRIFRPPEKAASMERVGTWKSMMAAVWNIPTTLALLLQWHRSLISGHMLWIAPLAVGLILVAEAIANSACYWSGWWGISFIALSTLGFAYSQGMLFAFFAPVHLYQNGTEDERRRVSWLRAVVLGTSVVFFLAQLPVFVLGASDTLGFSGEIFQRTKELIVVGLCALVVLIPTLFIMALTFAVLYGGALDPRVAVTRVTLWTILGVGLTLAFLFIERFVAMKIVAWLSLPPDSGAVMAGALVAGTFVPARRITERAVTRLADRILPISVVADGIRIVKTVMVTDLSGYTALSATDEPHALLLGALLKRQTERIVGAHGGKLIKTMGDAVMVTFTTNDGAIMAARELHNAFPEAAKAVGVEPLPLHTALNRGEIVESHDGDIYGQTVNVTARMVDVAGHGEIVVSESVREGIAANDSLTDIGARKFKNVPVPVVCFRVQGLVIRPTIEDARSMSE